MKLEWKFNCWTGDHTANVSKNMRIVRMGSEEPYLYSAEYWGDYSLKYPIKGPWQKSPVAALKEVQPLINQANTEESEK